MEKLNTTILINASAAKTGGAETILRTFVQELENYPYYNFIVLSPVLFKESYANVQFDLVSTNGFRTVWFTILGVRKYIKKYKPKSVISFNNLNYIFKPELGITYFHQPKALEEGYKDSKIRIYRYVISRFLRKNKFVVQSDYIRHKFLKSYDFNPRNVITSWPGFIIPRTESINLLNKNRAFSYYGLLPIAYAAQHKNVSLLKGLTGFLESKNILITTLLDKSNTVFDSDDKHIESIGGVNRSQMFDLYKQVDFLIFTSKDETVGLPIFEFLQTGKPAFVYAADYAIEFFKQFNKPENLILFKDVEEFKTLFLQKISLNVNSRDYSEGEWHKIIKLL
jgi:glycosyltransferase involved in cell wall biosynthesis